MANIAITSDCNLNCPYCFTQEAYQSGNDSTGHMTEEIFEQALAFIQRSDIKQVRILGGEPTIHPQFIGFMEKALQTGLPVRLFSNGLIPEKALDYLTDVQNDRLGIILNITRLMDESAALQPGLKKTFTMLHSKIILGLNIYKPDIHMEQMLRLIQKFGLDKRVRLGLAHPSIGYKNQYLSPGHYPAVGQDILRFAQEAKQQSVKIHLDCGFVPCMFGEEEFTGLGLEPDLGNHCEPIPDILPDGSMVPCYPLSGLAKVQPDTSSSVGSARDFFKKTIPEYDCTGIYKTCSLCEYKKKALCTGGCTAHKNLRFNSLVTISSKIEPGFYANR